MSFPWVLPHDLCVSDDEPSDSNTLQQLTLGLTSQSQEASIAGKSDTWQPCLHNDSGLLSRSDQSPHPAGTVPSRAVSRSPSNPGMACPLPKLRRQAEDLEPRQRARRALGPGHFVSMGRTAREQLAPTPTNPHDHPYLSTVARVGLAGTSFSEERLS